MCVNTCLPLTPPLSLDIGCLLRCGPFVYLTSLMLIWMYGSFLFLPVFLKKEKKKDLFRTSTGGKHMGLQVLKDNQVIN